MGEIVGVGSDITECLRIARLIERHGDLFINRVFTAEEVRYCRSRKQSTQHFTARWAAKEAVLRALGINHRRGISWRDIEVRNDPYGRSVVAIRGGVKELVGQFGIGKLFVSISHCHTHAVAQAIAIAADKEDAE